MKKILILVPDLSLPGGVANYYRTLQLDLQKNITYFTINKKNKQGAFRTASRLLTNYLKFSYIICKHNYDAVVVNPSIDTGKSFFRDSVFIMLAKVVKKETIVFFRGWLDDYEEKIKKSRFKSLLFNLSYAKADSYVVLGNIFKEKLIALGAPAASKFFIETTVADSKHLDQLVLDRKHLSFKTRICLLFLSRLEKEKGLYIAIHAYNKFRIDHPKRESCFFVAGDGEELNNAKAFVSRQSIPNIIFLGNITGEKKNEVLLQSHVMILPSITGEGLPNAILECMLYGMPIISRLTAGVPDIIQQNVNGYLTDSLDPSIFANFVSILALNEEIYKQMSETNQRIALEKFTTEKVRERILTIYNA